MTVIVGDGQNFFIVAEEGISIPNDRIVSDDGSHEDVSFRIELSDDSNEVNKIIVKNRGRDDIRFIYRGFFFSCLPALSYEVLGGETRKIDMTSGIRQICFPAETEYLDKKG